MKAAQQRTLMRYVHLAGSAFLGTYVYAPWKENPWFSLLVQALVVPALIATGLWMWLGARFQRKLAPKPPRTSLPTFR